MEYIGVDGLDTKYLTLHCSFILNFICVALFRNRTCGTCLLHGGICNALAHAGWMPGAVPVNIFVEPETFRHKKW